METTATLSKTYLGEILGHPVFAVDFDEAKLCYNMDVVEGANCCRYPFVPEGQIWVDCNMARHNWKPIIFHEMIETRLMQAGMDYAHAHEIANQHEREYRQQMGIGTGSVADQLRQALCKACCEGQQPEKYALDDEDSLASSWDDDETSARDRVVQDFRADPHGKQPWDVIPAHKVKRLWNDYATHGVVRNQRAVDEVSHHLLNNVHRITANTQLAGHHDNGLGAKNFYPDWSDEEDELFSNHIMHPTSPDGRYGQWRISDQHQRLNELAYGIHSAKTPEEKLLAADRLLSFSHPRSDIASWLIEGGSDTLDELAGRPATDDSEHYAAEQPSDRISAPKAREMLKNPPHGKPLSRKQKIAFEIAAHKDQNTAFLSPVDALEKYRAGEWTQAQLEAYATEQSLVSIP